MNKVKKISKYLVNILAIINALLIKLAPIWNINYLDKIIDTISVIIAVIGTYLLGSKTIFYVANKNQEIKTDLSLDEIDDNVILDSIKDNNSDMDE